MTIRYQMTIDGIDFATMRETLIADDFDNERTPEQYRKSFENSYAFVVAYDGDRIVGTARMLSDGVVNAYVVDVWTLSAYRRQGIARQMLALLEEQVRGQHIALWTEDAADFYERTGYVKREATLYQKVIGEWLKG